VAAHALEAVLHDCPSRGMRTLTAGDPPGEASPQESLR